MGQAALQDFHERSLIQPVLTYRLLPTWRRLLKVPALYRVYRGKGLLKSDAFRLAWMVMRHPRRLAKLNARWGQGVRRRA